METQKIDTNNDSYSYEYAPSETRNGEWLDLRGRSSHRRRTYVGFDISSAPVSNSVANVKIYLYVRAENISSYSDATGRFNRIITPWGESTLTWNNAPSVTNENQITHFIGRPTIGWYSYDITELYKDGKNNGDEFSIRIMDHNEYNDSSIEWASREYGGYKPYILIEYEDIAKTPIITQIGTEHPPKLCEPIQFTSTVTWNDDGWKSGDPGTGLQSAWWQYTKDGSEYIVETCGNELSWTPLSDTQWPKHIFTEADADIKHIRHIVENKYGERACAMIENFPLSSTNGLTIIADQALNGKPLIVWHAAKMPHTGTVGPDPNLYFSAFAWVRGTWNSVNAGTVYKVGTGDIRNTASPPFDSVALGTLFDGNMRDGYDCVILARDSPSSMEFGIFQAKDVFRIHSGSPTCVNLITASNDVITESIMGPVCDLFGIPRDTATEKLCSAFWAEFYDPIFIANYVSISQTGKDTLGNTRELTAFDHIALPFAVIGSLPGLSLLPFGALVTKGLGALSKAGVKFGDVAVRFMLDFSMDASNFVSTKDTWHFLDAIGQVTEAHATEIVNALTAGDTNLANTLLRQYAGESKGWWDYHTLNDMLRDALPVDTYNWLRTQIGLDEIGAGIVTNTAKQATLSADDVAKLADAALDSGVMDEATAAVLNSIKNIDTASVTKIDELKNILKNSPELSAKLVANHKSILDGVVAGGDISSVYVKTILNHAELAPADIVDLFKSIDSSIVPKLNDGTYNQALGNYIDTVKKHNEAVYAIGKEHGESWIRNGAKISRKAIDSTDPAKMSDIPHAAQEIAAKQDEIIEGASAGTGVPKADAEDLIFGDGMRVGDEIGEVTQVFADEVPTNWYAEARQRVFVIPNRIKTKWKSLKRYEKVLCIWFMVDNVAFIVYMIAKFLGLGPGDRGFDAWNLAKSVTDAKWLCKESCEDKRYGDLEGDIEILEGAIENLEDFLDKHEFSLKLEHNYDAPYSVLEIGKSALKLYQECLINSGIGVAPSTGKIEFICVDKDQQPIICAAYVDGRKVGVVWESGLLIEEVNPATYDLKMYAGGYVECTKTITVAAGGYVVFKCVMDPIGVCQPVTAVSIYIDPLSPVEDETISFNGSASSDDPIATWEWDFDDGSPNKLGQAVTHTYSRADVYTVVLKVTNDCGEYATTTRNVTVSEEEPQPESTTLSIQIPTGTDGNEISRYWEIEIWVDGKDTGCNPPETLTFGTAVYCDCVAPYNLVPCELGNHTITLKKSGYAPTSKLFYLEKDKPLVWTPVMAVSSGTGGIQLETNMPPFDGYVDGAFVGNSGERPNIYIPDQEVGQHIVKVYKGLGYDPEYCEGTVAVAADSLVVYRCDVTEIAQHTITIEIPAGAELWVDDQLIETTIVGRLSTILKDLRTK